MRQQDHRAHPRVGAIEPARHRGAAVEFGDLGVAQPAAPLALAHQVLGRRDGRGPVSLRPIASTRPRRQ